MGKTFKFYFVLISLFAFGNLAKADNCIAEGWYNLTIQGDFFNAQITGQIGNQSVWWRQSFGWIDGDIGGHNIRLRFNDQPRERMTIEGWIGERTYISWYSTGDRWWGYQSCIQ